MTSATGVRWGVNLPLPAHRLADQRPVIERLLDLGYDDVWTGEGLDIDGFTPLALAAAWRPELRVGTGVLPAFTRGPAVLAQTAASLAQAAAGGVLLGVGSSVPRFVTGANGIPYERPIARVRDTVRFLKQALAGAPVQGTFDSFAIEGFALPPGLVPAPGHAKVLVGALRKKMLNIGFRDGDGVMTNILLAEDLPAVIGEVDEPLDGKELVVKIFLCPSADRDAARAAGRRFVAGMLNLHTYKNFHAWLGRGDELAAMHAAWDAGDVAGAERAVPPHVLDGLWVSGPPEACREQIARFLHPAVTAINLYVAPTPELMRDPSSLAGILGALRPSGT
jgi:probable F420-dependent oxidoreductase